MAEALDVHEVAQRIVSQVHAVHEGQVDDRLGEVRKGVRAGEELVTGSPHEVEVAPDLGSEAVERIDGDALRSRQPQAEPVPHTDLQVRTWFERLVQRLQ